MSFSIRAKTSVFSHFAIESEVPTSPIMWRMPQTIQNQWQNFYSMPVPKNPYFAQFRGLAPLLAGYSFKHKPRVAKHRGGGLGILFKYSIGLKVKGTITTMTSFECMECSFPLNIHGALIYRVPPSQKNKIPQSLFIDEFSKLMESLSIGGGKLLVLGDFNIPWNKEDHPEREQLYDIILQPDAACGICNTSRRSNT